MFLVAVVSLAFSGAVRAIGLGEVVRSPVLGERLLLTIPILGDETGALDADCFRVVKPQRGDDLPWVRQAAVRVRPGKPPLLELRSQQVVREPIVQLAVQVLCGYEVWREYTLLASPLELAAESAVPASRNSPSSTPRGPQAVPERDPGAAAPVRRAPRLPAPRSLAAPAAAENTLQRHRPVTEGGLPTLRLATALGVPSAAAGVEAKRDLLRLEFRILMTLHDQALGQLDAAARLQQAEETLQALQGRTLALTEAAGEPLPPAAVSANAAPTERSAPAPQSVPAQVVVPAATGGTSAFSGWAFYGLLLGLLLGLAGWGLRHAYQEYLARKAAREFADDDFVEVLDEGAAGDDLMPPAASPMGNPRRQDENLISRGGLEIRELSKELPSTAAVAATAPDSLDSIGAETVDERFAADPVMELADIMLSFGRVKGAAQALREYVDNNPQEELKPWMRLLDVYRMAGMRDEFELVATNLNRYFNVEVLSWEEQLETPETQHLVPGLEDMPHVIGGIVRMWDSEDVIDYLYQLLRDNRGGQRQGFSIFVASEILFLIELKETVNRMKLEVSQPA